MKNNTSNLLHYRLDKCNILNLKLSLFTKPASKNLLPTTPAAMNMGVTEARMALGLRTYGPIPDEQTVLTHYNLRRLEARQLPERLDLALTIIANVQDSDVLRAHLPQTSPRDSIPSNVPPIALDRLKTSHMDKMFLGLAE